MWHITRNKNCLCIFFWSYQPTKPFGRPYPNWVVNIETGLGKTTCTYEVVSKIFRTGVAIYIAIVVARGIAPNRPNCEFRVILRRFMATAWKRAKTSPRNLTRIDLAASYWQRPVSHYRPHPAVSGEIKNDCHSPPTVLPWFSTLWLLPISKKWNWSWKDAGLIPLRRSRPNRRQCLKLWQKTTSSKCSKMEETVGPVSTCGRKLLRGWW
jgi:hypothetical protein